jgi:hypothetical protein
MVAPNLEDVFPGLRGQAYRITSPKDDGYNCIAYAVGDYGRWWWPDAAEEDVWPPGVVRAETIEAFRDAFATLGYAISDADEFENGFEKVAIFALDGAPKHASRQLPTGRWVSKLGKSEDIEHSLHDLEGDVYGSVALVMKRQMSVAARVPTE